MSFLNRLANLNTRIGREQIAGRIPRGTTTPVAFIAEVASTTRLFHAITHLTQFLKWGRRHNTPQGSTLGPIADTHMPERLVNSSARLNAPRIIDVAIRFPERTRAGRERRVGCPGEPIFGFVNAQKLRKQR
jgi:hypothetical protein